MADEDCRRIPFRRRANTDTEYEYDDNGNMTKDLNRGITDITYNALNLPTVVSFTDNSYIEYTYGANGQKLRTQYGVQPGLGPLTPADTGGSILAGETAGTDAVGTVPSMDELNRVDYCGNMVYDRGERRLLLEMDTSPSTSPQMPPLIISTSATTSATTAW